MDDFAPLSGVHKADTVIVGGGWTGLLTGYFLAGSGIQVALVTQSLPEPGPLCAALHQPDRYLRVAFHHGYDALQSHLSRMQRILSLLPGWLAPLTPFRESELYAYAHLPAELPILQAQQKLLARFGVAVHDAPDAGGCPFPVTRSIRSEALLISGEGLADALCQGICSGGGSIFAGSRAVNATATQVFTPLGRVDAKQVLLCTGKPLGLTGRRLLSLLETRTALRCRMKPPVPLHSLQTSVLPGGLTLLPADGYVTALWDAGRTGTRVEIYRTALLQRILRRRLPEWEAGPPSYSLQVHTADGLPVAGALPVPQGQLLTACGAEDLLTSLMAAQALARLALRRPHPEDLLLRPDRPLSRQAMKQATQLLRRRRTVNALRRNAPRCSHCGCRLRFHEAARWWGCPVCGSAYGLLGSRIGGPALMDADISATQRPGW